MPLEASIGNIFLLVSGDGVFVTVAAVFVLAST